MNLWDKMISGIVESVADVVLNIDTSDDALVEQMRAALAESHMIGRDSLHFIEPDEITAFQAKWDPTYTAVVSKTQGFFYRVGLSNKTFRQTATVFLQEFDSLSHKAQQHNEAVANSKISAIRNTICPVEGKSLDRQQLLCIAKEAHSHLVLAGAGTGKTTTIIGYIKYLLLSGKCCADDLLVLSFTNASASEMAQRITAETGKILDAYTFHKLGLNIITSVQGKTPKICNIEMRQFVRKQLDSLIQNDDYLKKLCYYLVFAGKPQKTEFDFTDAEEYQAYLKLNPPITMQKETVKSYGEMDIANFLFQNGIKYIYEAPYPVDTRTSEYGQYHPDFYLPDFDIYIEYFGINRTGDVPPYFEGRHGKSARETYQDGIQWKRELHRRNGTSLIEVYAYEKLEGSLLQAFSDRLRKKGVTLSERPIRDVWQSVADNSNQTLDRVAELFATVINLTKSNNCTIDDICQRNRKYRNLPDADIALDLTAPIFESYQALLAQNGEIDFNDMINLAAEYIVSGQYQHHYKYVVVDEYQDISQSRFRLLYAMRQQKDYQLFCVGDDWQSIYRFSGSDIGFILNFEKYWGASELSKIETTYRFPQSLIDISSGFIMKNPEQKEKTLHSAISNHGFSMERINGYTERKALEFLAERLLELPTDSTILFLGRYRFDIKMLEQSRQFEYRYNNSTKSVEVKFAKRRDLRITFMTAHSSKGLQADYVFLLNNKRYGMGFPSKIADASVLQLLLDNCDSYPYAEERRLFYVAITRAKKKVWLVTLKDNESEFVSEIDAVFGTSMKREQFTCPKCGGRLVRRTGKNGDFYGCSNYGSLGCRYTRNIVRSSRQNSPAKL